MDVITIESKAYKEIVAKIDVIANYVRLRAKGVVAFSNIGGRCYYKIGELKRLLEERLVKSNKENIDNLITNHQLYAKERRNTKQDK